MVHGAGEIGVRECDPAKRCAAQDLSRCGSSVFSKEKAGLRAQVCMTPAVQNDSRDVSLGVKPGAREHFTELFADSTFILPERGSE